MQSSMQNSKKNYKDINTTMLPEPVLPIATIKTIIEKQSICTKQVL